MSSKELKKNLDIIMSPPNRTLPEGTQPAEASGGQTDNADQPGIQMRQEADDGTNMQDPESIKNKGRPVKPKRWKDMVEQERQKSNAAKKKKAKKGGTSSSKNTEIIENSINIILIWIVYTNKNNNNAGPNGKSKKKMRTTTSNAYIERDGAQENSKAEDKNKQDHQ